MSLELPKFANELFDKIARENEFRDFSVEINSGSKPGDGFTSEMFRITIIENKSSKKLELLCKMASTNENRRKEFMSDIVYGREALFYQKIMPMFAKFQEEKQVPKSDQFQSYPKCYGAITDDEKQQYIIVLGDLRTLNFKMWDKSKPTSIETTRITMRELGKFHGLSIAFKDQNPAEFEDFKKLNNVLPKFFESKNAIDMFENAYIRGINSLKNEEHKNIVRHFKNNITRCFSDCFAENDVLERIGVLGHGDFWINNLLFRFNEKGLTEDIRFLDWQTIFYGSPGIDIVYNIFTSTDKALRDKEYDNLIKLYYESLSKIVKLLGSDPDQLFTYEDLLGELKRCGVHALLMAPANLQVAQADSSEISSIDEMLDKAAVGERKSDFVTGLSNERQLEYGQRLNDVFADVIKLGYYQLH